MPNSFRPIIRDNHIIAGGVRLAELDAQGRLIFEDRYRNRCLARGTPSVPVDLLELLQLLVDHYRIEPPPAF